MDNSVMAEPAVIRHFAVKADFPDTTPLRTFDEIVDFRAWRQLAFFPQMSLKSVFAAPMRNVTDEADSIVDIWPYVDSLDLDAVGLPSIHDVHYVYRDAASL